MLYVTETCPVCTAGNIGFRRCSDGVTIVLMCDECDSVWLDPARRSSADALAPATFSFEVPGTACAVGRGQAGWATRAEVERAGWLAHVAGERATG
jgi:hypothetical protein